MYSMTVLTYLVPSPYTVYNKPNICEALLIGDIYCTCERTLLCGKAYVLIIFRDKKYFQIIYFKSEEKLSFKMMNIEIRHQS